MRRLPTATLFAVLTAVIGAPDAFAQRLSAATHGQRPPGLGMQSSDLVEPIKMFDNLYYVGSTYVSAYLLTTSDGLIMIDSLHGDFTAQSLEQIAALGFDPGDIRYVLMSHGHRDHFGGATTIQARSGARVGMAEGDWDLAESTREPEFPVPTRDLVIADGDTLTQGDTTIKFYLTPGHTPGVASMEFPVYDNGQEYKAFLVAGHNVTESGEHASEAFKSFIDSHTRLQAELEGVDVNLTSHPWAALIFQRAELLAGRKPGDPNPFVDPEDFTAFLKERLETHEARLAELN